MTRRKFFIGDEWLYYKVYCGTQTSDILLTEVIAPIVGKLKEYNLIHSWFYVRYRDPNPHIRFRIKIIELESVGIVISICNKFFRPYLENNHVWKIQTDTYVRELERYGKSTIACVEEIFYYDSELLLEIMDLTRDESDTLQYVLISVESLLKVFGLCQQERAIFLQSNYSAYKERLVMEIGNLRVKANEFQRMMIIPFKNDTSNPQLLNHTKILAYIDKRDEKIACSVEEIIFQSRKSNTDIILFDLLQSIIHMYFNKAFNNQQVMYEFLGYNILLKRGYTELKRNEKE